MRTSDDAIALVEWIKRHKRSQEMTEENIRDLKADFPGIDVEGFRDIWPDVYPRTPEQFERMRQRFAD